MEGASHAPGVSKKSYKDLANVSEKGGDYEFKLASMSSAELEKEVARLQELMYEHARNLEFEQAAQIRDQLGKVNELFVLNS